MTPKCQLRLGDVANASSMYIECKQLTVQVSVFGERGNFVWIDSDQHEVAGEKVFGDKPRAMSK